MDCSAWISPLLVRLCVTAVKLPVCAVSVPVLTIFGAVKLRLLTAVTTFELVIDAAVMDKLPLDAIVPVLPMLDRADRFKLSGPTLCRDVDNVAGSRVLIVPALDMELPWIVSELTVEEVV